MECISKRFNQSHVKLDYILFTEIKLNIKNTIFELGNKEKKLNLYDDIKQNK